MQVPEELLGRGSCYGLQVSGDSMLEAGILDGDYVVIEQRDSARNGEFVVALVNNEEATLKRIEQQPGRVVLHPANAAMEPMAYSPDAVQIQGILRGLLRSCR
jgi:repressor LexA